MDLIDKLNVEKLTPFFETKLSDIGTINILKPETLSKKVEQPLGDITLSADADAGVSIDLYNEVGDLDHEDKDSSLDLKKAIAEATGNYLKYSLDANLKLSGGFTVPNIGIQSNITQGITFNSYRIHKPDENFQPALIDDLKTFRFVLSKDDVLALEEGEALSMVFRGSLHFKATFNWADAVTSSLTEISRILKTSDIIKLSLGASVSASASVDISDNFNLSVQKLDGKFVLNLVRAKKNVMNGSVGFQAGAKLDNPELIDEVITGAFDKAEGEVIGKADGLLDDLKAYGEKAITKSKFLQKVKDNADTLQKAMELFGLDGEVDKIKEDGEEYVQKYKDKRDEVKDSISKVLRSKVELSAAITYSRTKTTDTVFSATLTTTALKKYYGDLRFLNVSPVIEAFEKNESGVTITEYKKVTELIVSKGFAIGLSIAKWNLSYDNDKIRKLKTEEVLRDSRIQFRVSEYSNERDTAVMLGASMQHQGNIQLNAYMPDLVSEKALATCDRFDYELKLTYIEKHHPLRDKNEGEVRLRNLVDLAGTFDIIGAGDIQKEYNDLWEKTKGKDLDFKIFLTIPYGKLEEMLDELIEVDNSLLATAASEALPYIDLPGRRSMSERRTAYLSYFKEYFNVNAGNITPESIRRNMAERLAAFNLLADFESTYDEQNFGEIESNALAIQLGGNNISTDWSLFVKKTLKPLLKGMSLHYDKVLTNTKLRNRSTVFAVQKVYTQRFLARVLLAVAAEAGVTLQKGCSFTCDGEVYAYGEKSV